MAIDTKAMIFQPLIVSLVLGSSGFAFDVAPKESIDPLSLSVTLKAAGNVLFSGRAGVMDPTPSVHPSAKYFVLREWYASYSAVYDPVNGPIDQVEYRGQREPSHLVYTGDSRVGVEWYPPTYGRDLRTLWFIYKQTFVIVEQLPACKEVRRRTIQEIGVPLFALSDQKILCARWRIDREARLDWGTEPRHFDLLVIDKQLNTLEEYRTEKLPQDLYNILVSDEVIWRHCGNLIEGTIPKWSWCPPSPITFVLRDAQLRLDSSGSRIIFKKVVKSGR